MYDGLHQYCNVESSERSEVENELTLVRRGCSLEKSALLVISTSLTPVESRSMMLTYQDLRVLAESATCMGLDDSPDCRPRVRSLRCHGKLRWTS